jgi:hypothetical protein
MRRWFNMRSIEDQNRKVAKLLVLGLVMLPLCFMIFDFYAVYRRDIVSVFTSNSTYVRLNVVEGAIWGVVGFVLLLRALIMYLTDKVGFRATILAGAALVGLGITDGVEASTGAWWRPWWLLFWKAVCIAVLLLVIAIHFYERRRGPARDALAEHQ